VSKKKPSRRPTVPTRETSRTQAANYLKTALEAMAAGRWDTAVLLAVHAGISAADAVCVAHHGLRSISQRKARLSPPENGAKVFHEQEQMQPIGRGQFEVEVPVEGFRLIVFGVN